METKTGSLKILAHMMNIDPNAFSDNVRNNSDNELPLAIGFGTDYHQIKCSLDTDHTRTTEGINKLKDFILNPKLTQEKLDKIKQEETEYIREAKK